MLFTFQKNKKTKKQKQKQKKTKKKKNKSDILIGMEFFNIILYIGDTKIAILLKYFNFLKLFVHHTNDILLNI